MDKTVNKTKSFFVLDLNNYKYFATNCACFLAVKVYAFESVCFYLLCIVNLRRINSKITIYGNAIL